MYPVKVTKVTTSPAAVDVGKTVALKVACAPRNVTKELRLLAMVFVCLRMKCISIPKRNWQQRFLAASN